MAAELKRPASTVAGLVLITTAVLTGCSSTSTTSKPPATTASQVPTSTGSPTVPATTATTATRTTAGPAPSAPAPPTTAKRGLGPCQTRYLTLTQGSVDGTAGSSYVTYYLRSSGPDTCLMFGYPGFSLLFADGSVIQHPAKRSGLVPRAVALKPGQRVQFVVRALDGSIPGTGCSTGWKTATVQVYPPNQTAAIRQRSTIPACDLTVGPVTAA